MNESYETSTASSANDTVETASSEPRGSLGASDPYAREQQIFPVLPDEQIERMVDYGSVESFETGELLFERGQRGVDFFLILDGEIEIFDLDDQGKPTVITTHARHQFTGELDLFNNRKILVGGRTGTASRLLRLTRAQFNRMYSTEQDIGETIMRAFILRRSAFLQHDEAGVTVIGETNDRDLIRVRRFLSRNGYPSRHLPSSSDDTKRFATEHDIALDRLPVIWTPLGEPMVQPSIAQLADELGLTEDIPDDHVFDLAVIGGGPAGLSACVYAASENLDTIVIEAEAPGGQAGTSSKIENYLGFPTGISGQALAGRAWIQGQKFGAHFAIARAAERIRRTDDTFEIGTEGGRTVHARAVIIACGATYRRLNLDNYECYEGQGIHYAATALEAQFCTGTDVIVVGGGNSAGQAAVFLSRHAKHVHVLVRSDGLAASMSDYLVRRIDQSSRITLHPHTQITALAGDRLLRRVTWENSRSNEAQTRDISNVFVMIGAVPNTKWMGDCVKLDEKGFVLSGANAGDSVDHTLAPFQTSVPGIYVVGDARSGSVKRVASGVGEGSVCVSMVHGYLASLANVADEAR